MCQAANTYIYEFKEALRVYRVILQWKPTCLSIVQVTAAMATMNHAFIATSKPPVKPQEPHKISTSLLRLRFPVTISGTDATGKSFSEDTGTELVSPCGATIECSRSLAIDQEVIITLANKQVLARVVGQTGISETNHCYGITFLREDKYFWGVSFPKGVSAGHGLFLECSRCGNSYAPSVNEIEALVFQANRLLALPCSVCNDTDDWKIAEKPTALPDSSQIERYAVDSNKPSCELTLALNKEPNLVPIASMDHNELFRPVARGERRRHKRVNLSRAKACIEKPGSDPDVVDVDNVSLGGACVRSATYYPIGSWVRVACPYTIGGSNIFQSARIVRTGIVDGGHEYGLEYVQLV